MNIKKILFAVSIVAIIGAAVAVLGIGKYRNGKAVNSETVLFVPTGSSYRQLLDSLSSAGVSVDGIYFRAAAKLKGLSDKVRPGRYELKKGMSYPELVGMLRSGAQSPVRVTFNNIRTLPALAGAITRKLEPDSTAVAEVLMNDSIAQSYGFRPETFISMFIPDTYEFWWNCDPQTITDRMKREYDKFWQKRDPLLARTGLSREQAVTLASIVYEETKYKPEMARVAGVYMNRLREGMPLQADPTVKFAIGDFTIKRVLHRHLEVDSPYNTYKYAGLPPGPICMPSIAALDAVLNYETNDYLYFCAKDDLSGAHAFARDLAGHNRNAQAYARALDKLGIR